MKKYHSIITRTFYSLQIKDIGFKVETKAFKTKITLGFKEGNYVEVLTGLKESDRVITVGQDDVSHGVNITIMNKEEGIGESTALEMNNFH